MEHFRRSLARVFVARSRVLLAWIGCSAASALGQNLWIVDAAGGQGSHFRDLPAAVAAASDGDVLRVRVGTYSPFSVAGKGLRILGDDVATVAIRGSGPMVLGPTAPGQTLWLQNVALRLTPTSALPDAALRIEDAGGNVVLHGVRIEPEGTVASTTVAPSSLALRRCTGVHLLSVHVEGPVRATAGAAPGATAIDAEDCVLEISNCTVNGGSAASSTAPAPGGAALIMNRGLLFSARTSFLGGSGSTGCAATQLPGGDGGSGIEATGGAELVFAGRTTPWQIGVQGGEGGADCNRFGPYQGAGGVGIRLNASHARFEGFGPAGGRGRVPGAPSVLGGGGTVAQQLGSAPPLASIIGTPLPRSSVILSLEAPPGSLAFLAVSLDGVHVPFASPAFGSLLLIPSPAPLIGPEVVGSGSWALPVDLSTVWQRNLPLRLQYFCFDGNRVLASNSIALLVLSS